ncbi:FAD-dependent oxidoreductase [Paractinoplanes atraurantiacus]|uniref:2-polyprenyl-6-methoxyphenol hydroxylase n=1 Tax=Paractinoplanes atraurantiacus TaxID=1036182 RepID=A0A285HNZ8_9ACTN|nr:FAD-dependent oxidoreductase [Actinoplanes atraurantiacus]SNY37455.1 2-polyprenyl-6-methoxyphenol hydroxylase [Actinoplanes atraurantiacus]
MRWQTDVGILVVGAGPVGLATATALAQRGIDVTVVDRAAGAAHTSRAAVVHARTLEALDRIGAAAPLVAAGIPAPRFTIRDRDRVLVPVAFDGLPTPYPYALMVPQSTTEAVLNDRLTAAGGTVLRGQEVVGLDGATATFATGDQIRAHRVVAADGMNSTIRRLAGIGFGPAATSGSTSSRTATDASASGRTATDASGRAATDASGRAATDASGRAATDGESFTLADIKVDGGPARDEVVLYFSRAGMLVWAPLPDGTVRIVAAVDDAPEQPDIAYVQKLLSSRGPAREPAQVAEVVWGSRFRVHHRVADTFRAGPVLLAGDAGHVHSPAGGQGMNLGLRDALALADALADGSDAALDAYAAARRPAALEVVRFASRLTRLATVPAPARPLRNAALSALSLVPAFRSNLALRLAGLTDRP